MFRLLVAFLPILGLTAGFDVPDGFCAKYDLPVYLNAGLEALKCVDDLSLATTDCQPYLNCFDDVMKRGYTDGLSPHDFVQLILARYRDLINENSCSSLDLHWHIDNDKGEFLTGDCPEFTGLVDEYRFLDRFVPRDPSSPDFKLQDCEKTSKQLYEIQQEEKKRTSPNPLFGRVTDKCVLKNDTFSKHREILLNEWGFMKSLGLLSPPKGRVFEHELNLCANINFELRMIDLYDNYTCLLPAKNETTRTVVERMFKASEDFMLKHGMKEADSMALEIISRRLVAFFARQTWVESQDSKTPKSSKAVEGTSVHKNGIDTKEEKNIHQNVTNEEMQEKMAEKQEGSGGVSKVAIGDIESESSYIAVILIPVFLGVVAAAAAGICYHYRDDLNEKITAGSCCCPWILNIRARFGTTDSTIKYNAQADMIEFEAWPVSE